MFKRIVSFIVDQSGKRPLSTLGVALLLMAMAVFIASRLELRTELRELLPLDSKSYQAYERQAGRVGGGASLIVVVRSDDRTANRRLVEALADALRAKAEQRQKCNDACADTACHEACGPRLTRHIESDTKEVVRFFDKYKWMYASIEDLEKLDGELDLRIGAASGLVPDLDDEPDGTAKHGGEPAKDLEARARELEQTYDRLLGEFASGYFETPDGRMAGLRIVSMSTGMGDRGAVKLLDEVRETVATIDPQRFAPGMEVGYGGTIPKAIEEQDSIASEAVWVTALALALILGGVVVFYRSPWSIVIIGLPAVFGASVGFAYATAQYGYVNTVGAFLGAIIVGNGINYPIVLLSRYRDFRARGFAADEARRQAVFNAFRAELVGASVAAIAYGSLTITRFRGFSQFGTIGFVGMLAVWAAIVPLVPALVVLIERLQAKLPPWMRDPPPTVAVDGAPSMATRLLARLVTRHPIPILVSAAVVTIAAATQLPSYLRDPWEYNFARLGSSESKKTGAGKWSLEADRVFGGKMNVAGAMMVADRPEQVPSIAQRILEKDAADPQGRLVHEVATVWDLLPGPVERQREKLAILESIRKKLTPNVVAKLNPSERDHAMALARHDDLRILRPEDLPALLRLRFEENDGTIGTVFYVKYRNDVSFSDGRNLLRMAATTGEIELPDGSTVVTASRPSVFAEMIRSMERDGPLATTVALAAVTIVVLVAASNFLGAGTVIVSLLLGVVWTVGAMAFLDTKLNFLNFIALPITFGIGCEYPFNLFDRARLLQGDIAMAVHRSAGPIALCSYTTTLGYGSLVFADNQALQSFGRYAACGEIACATSALVVLPALLTVLSRFGWLKGRWLRRRGQAAPAA